MLYNLYFLYKLAENINSVRCYSKNEVGILLRNKIHVLSFRRVFCRVYCNKQLNNKERINSLLDNKTV